MMGMFPKKQTPYMNNPRPVESHYDNSYFLWQKTIGEFGARVNKAKFQRFIKSHDRLADFGCGGAYLLAALNAAEKLGIEINPAAIETAKTNGIKCVNAPEGMTDDWADIIISNSALEHVNNPIKILKTLRSKVKVGGLIVFSVPHEHTSWRFKRDDINHHLFTWSPMSAGHLFMEAGFEVLDVEVSRQIWPPYARQFYAVLGAGLFRLTCFVYRLLRIAFSYFKPVGVDAGILVIARRSQK
jgi:SAM-dependent methyltransferase